MCKHGEIEWVPELGPHGRYIDKCMVDFIRELILRDVKTLACCCGHGVYSQTIVVKEVNTKIPFEIHTLVQLKKRDGRPRTRRFYETDENGLYFIPEVVEYNKIHQ